MKDHLPESLIQRFVLNQGSREDNRMVVRHLLRRCPVCARRLREAARPAVPIQDYDAAIRRWEESYRAKSRPAVEPRSHEEDSLPASVWRSLGFYRVAAKQFAERGLTLQRLRGMRRRELRAIPGVGQRTLETLERVLGAPIPDDAPERPFCYWREKGIHPVAARALSEAGIESVADLEGTSREELEAIRYVGPVVVARLEELAGMRFPCHIDFWKRQGLPTRVVNALANAGIDTEADFVALTRERFLMIDRMGERSLRLCEEAVGRKLASPFRSWKASGVTRKLARKLVGAGIDTLEQLRSMTIGDLRDAGFDWTEIACCERLKESWSFP